MLPWSISEGLFSFEGSPSPLMSGFGLPGHHSITVEKGNSPEKKQVDLGLTSIKLE